MSDDNFNVDEILDKLFSEDRETELSLSDAFYSRISQLNISTTQALAIIGIESRTLKGILSGTQKKVDFSALIKIANFLDYDLDRIIGLFIKEIQSKNSDLNVYSGDKASFIKKNFDLLSLRKKGIIQNTNDFEQIEHQLINFTGLKDIYSYVPPNINIAFSSSKIRSYNSLNRSLWVKRSMDILSQLGNPFKYDREAVIKFFGEIRWHSKNVENGLVNVAKILYEYGVTIIFQTSLPSIQIRGATFAINDKPCIVLTDYRGFYPTLWFGLMHELFHVLFDWDDIKRSKIHISEEDSKVLIEQEREKMADEFAREYLLPKEKLNRISKNIKSDHDVNFFAEANDIHRSFVYLFYAYQRGTADKYAWRKIHQVNPPIEQCVGKFQNWSSEGPNSIQEVVNHLRENIYS